MSLMKTLQKKPWSAGQMVGSAVVVAAVTAAFWLLFLFHELVLILLAAIVISTAVQIPLSYLVERGLSKRTAVILIFLLSLALLIGASLLLIPIIGDQVIVMNRELAEGYQALRQQMLDSSNLVLRRLGSAIPAQPPIAALFEMSNGATAESDTEIGQTATMTTDLIKAALSVLITVLMAFYWTWEEAQIQQRFFLLLPMRQREHTRQLVNRIKTKVGQYLLGQAFLSLIVGLVSLFAYWLIGLPYTVALAVFAGLMEAVPLIGPWIGAVPAILVAFSVSPASVLWVIIASVLIQQLENNLLVPRVMARTVGVRPLVSVLALLGLGALFGVVGALIAIPLAATFQLLLDDWLARRDEEAQDKATGRDQLSRLRYETDLLIQDIRDHLRQKQEIANDGSDEIEDAVELLAHDLQTLLAQREEQA
jgi:predicted PurR-regulated permease PerM